MSKIPICKTTKVNNKMTKIQTYFVPSSKLDMESNKLKKTTFQKIL